MSASYALKHNPTTITTPVYGVVGPSGTAWKVVNRSTVGHVGISLRSGGAVTNGAPGVKGASIQGSSNSLGAHPKYSIGVYIDGSGSVANFGAISGYAGVKVIGAPGTVRNFGTISGLDGVNLSQGGTVINSGTADISGFYGVYLRNGGILINGSAKASVHGIGLGTGVVSGNAAATVTNFGDIVGESGIDLRRGGAIANFGTISGTKFAVELDHGGIVTNGAVGASGASILGVVEIAGVNGAVTNFGTISGRGFGVALELDHGASSPMARSARRAR